MFAAENAKFGDGHDYLPWYLSAVPVLGNAVNLALAITYGDWGYAAMYGGFLALDVFTLGFGKVATAPLQMGVEAAVEQTVEQTAKATAMQVAGRVAVSLGSKVVIGGGIGMLTGAASGAAMAYASGADWDQIRAASRQGATTGLRDGALGGLYHWMMNPTCFAAGTEVVAGVTYEDEEGIIREVTARRLSQMGKQRRLATLEAAKLKVVKYLTIPIELLQKGDWVITRDESDVDGELILTQIEEKFERIAYHLRHLTLQSSNGQTQTIPTTNEHPAYDPATGLWIKAAEFEIGQSLSELPGDQATITDTQQQRQGQSTIVYNFRLAQGYTYFVREVGSDAEPVWVHNSYREMVAQNAYDELEYVENETSGSLRRPYLRADTRRAIVEAADRTRSGRFIDAVTRKIIKGKAQIGHIFGRENWRRLIQEAEQRGMTQAEFTDWVNKHPEWFQIQSAESNLSHAYEMPR